jgi:hypothetical protein
MLPAPFSVHEMVPPLDDAPLTVAVPSGQIVWVPPAEAVGVTTPVPVNDMVGELLFGDVLATVIVAFFRPIVVGVNVTLKVTVPPPPIMVVEDKLLTTNSVLSEMTVTLSAVEPTFVIVYVMGAAAVLIQILPLSLVPDTASTGPVIRDGTSSPEPRSTEVPGYPVKLILANLFSVNPAELPKKIWPFVPVVPYPPDQPVIVKVVPAQVVEPLGAKTKE